MTDPTEIDFRHGGLDRPYLLQGAEVGAADAPAPLVIELHGRGITATQFDTWTGFGELAERSGFVLVLPSAHNEIWNDGRHPTLDLPNDVDYILAVIADVQRRLNVDGDRIYAFGMSNGGSMVGRLLCEGAGPIAAVAQVSGTVAADLAAGCGWDMPVPVLQIHGTSDRVNPYAGGTATGLIQRLAAIGRARPQAVLGVEARASLCVAANRASDTPETSRRGDDVTIRKWHGPTPRSDVVFASLLGGGHTWPGSRAYVPRLILGRTIKTFDATTTIWDFFAAHPRQAPAVSAPAAAA